MATSRQIIIFCGLLLTANTATALTQRSGDPAGPPETSTSTDNSTEVCHEGITCVTGSDVALGVTVGVLTAVAVPYVVTAAGFGAAGVAASSLAAKAMSVAWSTGVGVSTVGTLQAVGTAGLTLSQSAFIASIVGTVTTATKKAFFDGDQERSGDRSDRAGPPETSTSTDDSTEVCHEGRTCVTGSDVALGVTVGVLQVAAVPHVADGVDAPFLAAKAMSEAWSKGVGVGAGAVGTLEAVGTAGLTLAQSAVVAGIVGTVTTATKKAFFDGEQEDK